MKNIILISLTIMLFSCSKNVLQSGQSCIQEKINTFKSLPKGNPPRSIIEYTYKGKKVLYVPAQCCDQFSDLYDESCKLLGHPDGGITGKGDGKFSDFSTEAKNPIVIWKDDR